MEPFGCPSYMNITKVFEGKNCCENKHFHEKFYIYKKITDP